MRAAVEPRWARLYTIGCNVLDTALANLDNVSARCDIKPDDPLQRAAENQVTYEKVRAAGCIGGEHTGAEDWTTLGVVFTSCVLPVRALGESCWDWLELTQPKTQKRSTQRHKVAVPDGRVGSAIVEHGPCGRRLIEGSTLNCFRTRGGVVQWNIVGHVESECSCRSGVGFRDDCFSRSGKCGARWTTWRGRVVGSIAYWFGT